MVMRIRTSGRQKGERAGLEGGRAAWGWATYSLGDLTLTVFKTGIHPLLVHLRGLL